MSTKKASTETTAAEKQESNEAAVTTETVTEETAAAKTTKRSAAAVPVKEALYTHQQLIDGCKAFETSRAIVATALRGTEEELLTETEAKEIINAFKNKKR